MSRFLDKCMTARMGKEYSFHLIASVSSHWLGSLDQRGFNAVSWLDSWLWTFSWLTMSPWIDPTIESPSGQNGLILTVHALGFSMDGGSIPSLVLFFDFVSCSCSQAYSPRPTVSLAVLLQRGIRLPLLYNRPTHFTLVSERTSILWPCPTRVSHNFSYWGLCVPCCTGIVFFCAVVVLSTGVKFTRSD